MYIDKDFCNAISSLSSDPDGTETISRSFSVGSLMTLGGLELPPVSMKGLG